MKRKNKTLYPRPEKCVDNGRCRFFVLKTDHKKLNFEKGIKKTVSDLYANGRTVDNITNEIDKVYNEKRKKLGLKSIEVTEYSIYRLLKEMKHINKDEFIDKCKTDLLHAKNPFRCKHPQMSGICIRGEDCPKRRKVEEIEDKDKIDDVFVTEDMVEERNKYLKDKKYGRLDDE